MKEFDYRVTNRYGASYVQTAEKLADKADTFKSKVLITKGRVTSDVTKIISLLSLCIMRGDMIHVTVNGDDETVAVRAIKKFFLTNL